MWYTNLQNFFSVLQYSIIFSSVENYHKMLFKPFMEMINIVCPQNWYPYHWQTLNKLQMDFFYDYSTADILDKSVFTLKSKFPNRQIFPISWFINQSSEIKVYSQMECFFIKIWLNLIL